MGHVRLQREPFHVDEAIRSLTTPRTGGVALYVGTVRADDDGQPVDALTYEAFLEMAQTQLERLCQDTIRDFRLQDALVIHRLGRLAAAEPILLVAVAGAHRKEAFAALDHFMDQLKRVVPIWKREEGPAGGAWILGHDNQRVAP